MVAALEGRQAAAILGGGNVIGVIARQIAELFALSRARHEIGGFLLPSSDLLRGLAFGRDQDLAQKNLLFAREFGLVLVVIFPLIRFRDGDLGADLLGDYPLREQLVGHLLP